MVPQVPPYQELAPSDLLALDILTGGNVHLLSFGRNDVSRTLADSCGQEA